MLVACALIILFSVGFVLPCMLDITMTPDSEFTTFGKGTWLLIAGAFWIFGATAWLLVGRPRRLTLLRRTSHYPHGLGPAEARRRHPAAQAAGAYADAFGPTGLLSAPAPLGPDDDSAFIEELARRIREGRDKSLLVRAAAGRSAHAGVGVQAGDPEVDTDHVEQQAPEGD